MHSPFFPPLRRWASLVLTLLLCNSSPGVVIVEENFSYATTAWNSAINGNYNGGAGSWSGSWMYNPGLHSNPGAAIFGLSGYEPYGPQQAYAQGHGGGIERTISLTLSATAGSVYYFAADLFTPELDPAGPTAIYLNFGGYSLGIDSQNFDDGRGYRTGELIMFAPNGASTSTRTNNPTNLWGHGNACRQGWNLPAPTRL